MEQRINRETVLHMALDMPNMSYKEIGRRCGCTRQRVGQILSEYGVSRQRVQVVKSHSLVGRLARWLRG